MGRHSVERELALFVIESVEKYTAVPSATDAERAGVCTRAVAWRYYRAWLKAGMLSRPFGENSNTIAPGHNWAMLKYVDGKPKTK